MFNYVQQIATYEKDYDADRRVQNKFPKYVITMEKLDMSRYGIKHQNIQDFLLTEE